MPDMTSPAGVGQELSSEAAESARMAAVARYDILDTPPDGAFDRIAALAAQLLDAPIATVTIVDRDRIWFKATHGLDGVTQTGRDPGLCASAILQDEPYLIVDAANDLRAMSNPLVRGKLGIRFYAAAPITTSDGYRLGTVNVLDTRVRHLDESKLAMLGDLAAVVMDHLELRLSALTTLRHERDLRKQAEQDRATINEFAGMLRRSLLPPALPQVPGMELGCHYHAASPRDVLGDFYDVFALGGGRWAFVLGDVEGHGAAAAAVTSLARYTVRAAALHDPDPVAVLTEVNTVLRTDPHTTKFCTLLYGVLTPDATGVRVTLGTGGHPPALLLRPDTGQTCGTVELLELSGGQLVGILDNPAFTSRELRIYPGDTLLLHTDGLTEARPNGEFFGEHGLARFLSQRTDTSAAALVTDLVELIDGFEPCPADDIAVLALHAVRTS